MVGGGTLSVPWPPLNGGDAGFLSTDFLTTGFLTTDFLTTGFLIIFLATELTGAFLGVAITGATKKVPAPQRMVENKTTIKIKRFIKSYYSTKPKKVRIYPHLAL